jgi:hypothetical protein
MTTTTTSAAIEIYSHGLCYASVCAPKEMPLADVAAELNRQLPTGISFPWKPDEAPTFRGGQPNPCPCAKDPSRVHRLFSC